LGQPPSIIAATTAISNKHNNDPFNVLFAGVVRDLYHKEVNVVYVLVDKDLSPLESDSK